MTRAQPEQQVHRAIVQGLKAALPHGWLVRTDRGNPRNAIAGRIQKGMGAVKGWPDIEIIGRDKRDNPATWHIEVKAPKGRVQPEQEAVHESLRLLGRPVGIARSWDDVKHFAAEWGWPWRASQ